MHDRPDMRRLEASAYSQHGYFTTTQARECGFSSQLLSHHVRRDRFERVRRGLYRLPGFPRAEDDEMREKWMAVGPNKGRPLTPKRARPARSQRQHSQCGPPSRRAPIPWPPPTGRRRHPHPSRRGRGRHGLARRTPAYCSCPNAHRRSRRNPARAAGDGRASGTRPRASHRA